ncbi:MAG: hypothetical protein HY300_19370 [Verrucomicrobia bacterium]|nr:hypothetical protein [Verrucomicrobiota bacterium]
MATLATMFCFGLFGLIVQALQKTPTGVAFVWSGMSVAAFLAGTALGWLYWLIVGRVLTSPSSRTGRSRFLACSLPIVVAALAAYVFIPLKLTGGEKLKEIFIGLVLASLALGVVGFAMWRVIKFLNEDQEQQQKKDE